jgi:hypothetical protein
MKVVCLHRGRQRIAKVSDNPPQRGRESRRVRREQAHQLAKELLKSSRNPLSPHRAYGTDLLWAFIFFLIHVGWSYIVPEETLLSVTAAWLLWGCALFFMARLFAHWSQDKNWHRFLRLGVVATATVVFLYFGAASIWLIAQPVYIYLVPTHNLIEAERRAFFVTQVGPRPLTNIQIALRDNKSGAIQLEKYSEIDASPQNPLAPHYFWFTPSTPWDEDYTVTITSSKKPRAIQHLIVRSTHHLIQFATDVRIEGGSTPLLECRDPLLPASYQLARNSTQPCDKWMELSPEVEDRLQPAPYNVELPDGSVTVKRLRVLNAQSEPESQSDTRHLSEWQRGKIGSGVSQYLGKKILIMASSGKNTWSYAQDFRDVFASSGWKVEGPKHVPPIDELIIDVQLSANGMLGTPPKAEALAVLNSFKEAGIKHRERFMLDPDISSDLLVLWVGAKSPEGISPDECTPISFKPKPGASKPCSLVSQTPKAVPFPPP